MDNDQDIFKTKGTVNLTSLNDSVAVLKGVGTKRLVALNKLGINTINDLLTYFPRRYDDLSIKDLSNAIDGQKVTVKGMVIAPPTLTYFGRKKKSFGLSSENQ